MQTLCLSDVLRCYIYRMYSDVMFIGCTQLLCLSDVLGCYVSHPSHFAASVQDGMEATRRLRSELGFDNLIIGITGAIDFCMIYFHINSFSHLTLTFIIGLSGCALLHRPGNALDDDIRQFRSAGVGECRSFVHVYLHIYPPVYLPTYPPTYLPTNSIL